VYAIQCRFVVNPVALINSWPELIKCGAVEFIDPAEEETTYIAMYPLKLEHARDRSHPDHHITSFTHCEIDPGGILGVCAAIVPFANHGQAPRLTFQV
jgi:DNA-directed RNA polymerase II subunit RPB2